MYGTNTCQYFFEIGKDQISNHSLFDFLNPTDKMALVSALEGDINCSINVQIKSEKNKSDCLLTFVHVSDEARKYFWVQIKRNHKNLVQGKDESFFGMIKGTMSSSIYYECNKLRVTTSRIQDEINGFRK